MPFMHTRFGLVVGSGMLAAATVPSVVVAQSIPMAPHRAAYELTLVGNPSKAISSASGRMAVEVTGNACEGYVTTFRLLTQMADGEGDSRQSELTSTTFETGDGKSLRFNSSTRMNNAVVNATEGNAVRGTDGGIAIALRRPTTTKLDVDGDAIFPTEHNARLIDAARKGERIVEVKVYDGSDDGQKIYDTTALIGPAVPATGRAAEEEAKKAGLGAMRRWPVSLSYFAPGAGERVPTYALSFDMYENGVSGALTMNFGEFSLKGELKKLEMLKMSDCKK
jgi:EipB-like